MKYNGLNNYAGIGCFESRDDISLISVPDLCWLKNENEVYAVNKALIEQAERFQDRFAILDIPKQLDCVKAREWAVKLRSPFAAAYYSYIDVTDPLDISGTGTIRLPPSGAVCGCIAAIDGEKGVYHKKQVNFKEMAIKNGFSFPKGNAFVDFEAPNDPVLRGGVSFGNEQIAKGVMVESITDSDNPTKIIYDPSHPDADENGYVELPNINVVEEMVNMVNASRAYEANITIAQTTKTMIQSAINI